MVGLSPAAEGEEEQVASPMGHAVLEKTNSVIVGINLVFPCVETSRLSNICEAYYEVCKDALSLFIQLALQMEVLSLCCLYFVYKSVNACVVVLLSPLQLVNLVLKTRLPTSMHVFLPSLHCAILHVLFEAIGGFLNEGSSKTNTLLVRFERVEAALLQFLVILGKVPV